MRRTAFTFHQERIYLEQRKNLLAVKRPKDRSREVLSPSHPNSGFQDSSTHCASCSGTKWCKSTIPQARPHSQFFQNFWRRRTNSKESEELISSQARSACIHAAHWGRSPSSDFPLLGWVSSELSTKDICPETCLAHKVALHAKE